MNSVMFSLMWTLSPILVACIGFFTFVIQGNELTVSIAFTVLNSLLLCTSKPLKKLCVLEYCTFQHDQVSTLSNMRTCTNHIILGLP